MALKPHHVRTAREIIGQNLTFLRKREGWSQGELAQKFGWNVTGKSVGTYERGECDMSHAQLTDLCNHFGLSRDLLSGFFLDQFSDTELDGLREFTTDTHSLMQRNVIPAAVSPTVRIALDEQTDRRNRIYLVPSRAAAGYVAGFADEDLDEKLDTITLPGLTSGYRYRAFEIQGDSMLPTPSGSIIVGRAVEDPAYLRPGAAYIVVTQEGIVYKRVQEGISATNHFLLVSDNSMYRPYEIAKSDVREFWEAYKVISTVSN